MSAWKRCAQALPSLRQEVREGQRGEEEVRDGQQCGDDGEEAVKDFDVDGVAMQKEVAYNVAHKDGETNKQPRQNWGA